MITQRGTCMHTAKLQVDTRYEYIFSLTFID